jgi:hypothetical protein
MVKTRPATLGFAPTLPLPSHAAMRTRPSSLVRHPIPLLFSSTNALVCSAVWFRQSSRWMTESGRLFVFGKNEWGQLGLGHKTKISKPTHVAGEENKHLTSFILLWPARCCGQRVLKRNSIW